MRLADAGSLCMMGMVFATVALFSSFYLPRQKVDYCEARIWCGVPPRALGVFV